MPSIPSVSIVVAGFDEAGALREALDSCISQTLRNIEIICLDGSKTLPSSTLLDGADLRDPRIRALQQGQELSVAEAHRVGVAAARAPYVVFVDRDDRLLPSAIADSLAVAERTQADLVEFGVEGDSHTDLTSHHQAHRGSERRSLSGLEIPGEMFPVDESSRRDARRYLFRTSLLRRAYELLQADPERPQNDERPLMFLAALSATRYSSVGNGYSRVPRAHDDTQGSSLTEEDLRDRIRDIAEFEGIAAVVNEIARVQEAPGVILDLYESNRLMQIGDVASRILVGVPAHVAIGALRTLSAQTTPPDIAIAVAEHRPDALPALRAMHPPLALGLKPVEGILLVVRSLGADAISALAIAQAALLDRSGFLVTVVARQRGSDVSALPKNANFVEMAGRTASERLQEWAVICQTRRVGAIIDHQVLDDLEWPQFALVARTLEIATIGWIHRPIHDQSTSHVDSTLRQQLQMLSTVVVNSAIDVAFWKERDVPRTVCLPTLALRLDRGETAVVHRTAPRQHYTLVWWVPDERPGVQHSSIFAVARELMSRSQNYRITVAGGAWLSQVGPHFEALSKRNGLEGRIELRPMRNVADIADALHNADAVVVPAIFEGGDSIVLEAQIRGLPVFAWRVPWLKSQREDAGLVFAPHDDEAAIATQIAAVMGSTERYRLHSDESTRAARLALSSDFPRTYRQLITGTLPPACSPEPDADAREALSLRDDFYTRNQSRHNDADSHLRREPSPSSRTAPGNARGTTPPQGIRPKARPFARTLLQLIPALRPLAHSAKRAYLTLRR